MSSIGGRPGSVYASSSIAGGSGGFTNATTGGEMVGSHLTFVNSSADMIRFRILERSESSTLKIIIEVRIGAGWIPTGFEFETGQLPS